MREFALLDHEADTDPEEREAQEAYEAEMQLAAAGDWDALGLDSPGAPAASVEQPGERVQPITIHDFLNS